MGAVLVATLFGTVIFFRKKGRSIADVALSFWWISWFGIIGGFLFVGASEFRRELSQGGAASHFCLTLLIIVTLLWIMFFVADSKVKNREPAVVNLLTVMGTILAVFTILGIFFFIAIAPRVR